MTNETSKTYQQEKAEKKIGIIAYPLFHQRHQLLWDCGSSLWMNEVNDDSICSSIVPIDLYLMKNPRTLDKLTYLMRSANGTSEFMSSCSDILEEIYLDMRLSEYDIFLIYHNDTILYEALCMFLKSKGHSLIAYTTSDEKSAEMVSSGLVDISINYVGLLMDKKDHLKKILHSLHDKEKLLSVPGINFSSGKHIFEGGKQASYGVMGLDHHVSYDKNHIEGLSLYSSNIRIMNDLFSTFPLYYSFSSGCLNSCAYCESKRFPFKSKNPKQIVADLKKIVSYTGIRYIYFTDANIALSKDFIFELCYEIKKSNLNILWSADIYPARFLSKDTFTLMSEVGCVLLRFGVESGSDDLLKFHDRNISSERIKKCLIDASSSNIITCVGIMVGLPGEKDEDFRLTLEFARNMRDHVDYFNISKFWLAKGSKIHSDPEYYGIAQLKGDSFIYLNSHGSPDDTHHDVVTERFDKLRETLDFSEAEIYFGQFYDNIIYPLFDHLRSKKKVKNFLISNNHMIFKTHGYFSISLGLASNQKELTHDAARVENDYRFVDFSFFGDSLDSFLSSNFSYYDLHSIIITGGEPLIHPQILKFLKYAKKKVKKIMLKTNARMLSNLSFCKRISEYVDCIIVIDPANNKDDYEKISGSEYAWEQSRKGILNWEQQGGRIEHWFP